jgi:hypothetical protein
MDVDVANISTMFAKAGQSLKHPKVRIAKGIEEAISLSIKGDVLYVNDANAIDSRRTEQTGYFCYIYYGKIVDGKFLPVRTCPQWVTDLLLRFAADPIAEATNYGRLTGRCCFCGRSLTDENSTARGFGPICAERYGL